MASRGDNCLVLAPPPPSTCTRVQRKLRCTPMFAIDWDYVCRSRHGLEPQTSRLLAAPHMDMDMDMDMFAPRIRDSFAILFCLCCGLPAIYYICVRALPAGCRAALEDWWDDLHWHYDRATRAASAGAAAGSRAGLSPAAWLAQARAVREASSRGSAPDIVLEPWHPMRKSGLCLTFSSYPAARRSPSDSGAPPTNSASAGRAHHSPRR